MTFWIVAFVMTAAVAALIVLAFFRGGAEQGAAEADMQVYKDQLAEVDRDLARGVLTEAEAATVRVEVSRRLLEADRQATGAREAAGPSRMVTGAVAGATALAVIGGAFLLYRSVGAPGYPDLPLEARLAAAEEARANRPSQEDAERDAAAMPGLPVDASQEYLDLVERLRAAIAQRPDDLQGHRLLARNEAALGNFSAARAAQARVIELLGDTATAEDWAGYADLLVLAAGGYVSPEAETAIAKSLELDRTNGTARYYSGLLFVQTGRPDLGYRIWRALLDQSAPDDPWVEPIRAQIEPLARLAGDERFQLPPLTPPVAGRGPTAEDMAAAADMTPEQRMEMIRGMVQGLSDRLATEGGPPEDWARLIGALGVLGETDRARAISDEALTVFAGNDEAIATIEAARARAGLE